MVVFIIVAVLISTVVATRLDAEVDLETPHVPLNCKPLSNLIECDNPEPQRLGAGSFGVAWLVKMKTRSSVLDDSGGMVVLKTFFNQNKDGYLTQEDYEPTSPSFKSLQLAREECDIAMRIHQKAEGRSHPGAHHLVQCYSHNIAKGDTTPLYTLMDFVGSAELGSFLNSTLLTLDDPMYVMRSIFKQILLGLDFLATLKPAVIHHDLKPSNVVIKTSKGKDGKTFYTAHIIDYGGTLEAKKDTTCLSNGNFALTGIYAPPEVYLDEARCDETSHTMYHPEAPGAFDVWSAAMLWWDMFAGINGAELIEEVRTLWCANVKRHWCKGQGHLSKSAHGAGDHDDAELIRMKEHDADEFSVKEHFLGNTCMRERATCSKRFKVLSGSMLNYEGIGQMIRFANHDFFHTTVASITDKNHEKYEIGQPEFRTKFVEKMMADQNVSSFVKFLMKEAVVKDAKYRATAAELLKHEFLSGVEVPDMSVLKERTELAEAASLAAKEAAMISGEKAEALLFHEVHAHERVIVDAKSDEGREDESVSDDSSDSDTSFTMYDVPFEIRKERDENATGSTGLLNTLMRFGRSVQSMGSRWLW